MKTRLSRTLTCGLLAATTSVLAQERAAVQSGSVAPPDYEVIPIVGGLIGASALAINNNGQAVGWFAPVRLGGTIAFSWTPTGGLVDISGLGTNSERNQAVAVNDGGQVVGAIYGRDPSFHHHAFLWTVMSGTVDLGTLGGTNSEATSINATGQVAGWSETTGGPRHAFLWTEAGGMRDLGTLGGPAARLPR
jgi:probable HAF family extracellular repeat protein